MDSKILLLSLGLLTTLFTGCSRDPVTTVPGHLQPGNSIDVAKAALGSGGSQNEGGTIGVVPVIDYAAPNIPLMQDGVVDVLYFVPAESKDGEALRDWHYVYVKVADQSFTQSHKNAYKSLLNASGTNLKRSNFRPQSSRLSNQTRPNDGTEMPHTMSGEDTTRLTVVEVDEGGSAVNILGSQQMTGTPEISQDSMLKMVESFNKQAEAQRKLVQPEDD